jgi:hypothetical protein
VHLGAAHVPKRAALTAIFDCPKSGDRSPPLGDAAHRLGARLLKLFGKSFALAASRRAITRAIPFLLALAPYVTIALDGVRLVLVTWLPAEPVSASLLDPYNIAEVASFVN